MLCHIIPACTGYLNRPLHTVSIFVAVLCHLLHEVLPFQTYFHHLFQCLCQSLSSTGPFHLFRTSLPNCLPPYLSHVHTSSTVFSLAHYTCFLLHLNFPTTHSHSIARAHQHCMSSPAFAAHILLRYNITLCLQPFVQRECA